MSNVAQFQLVEFILLLYLCHIGIKRLNPEVDVPFLGLFGASAFNALLFSFLPPNKLTWLFTIVITAICIYLLHINQKRSISESSPKKRAKHYSLTSIGWIFSIFITIFLLSMTLLLPMSRSQLGYDLVSSRDKLLVQVLESEDNLTHINIVQAINKKGSSTYFDSTTDWNPYLPPTVSSYPQLAHSFTSNIKVAVHDITKLSSKPKSDITDTIWAYSLSSFFFMGIAISLASCVVISILIKIKNIDERVRLLSAILFILFALKTFMPPILSFGFFTQSAVMIGFLLAFLFESSESIHNINEQRFVQNSVIRLIPIILIGQTWWLLTSVIGVFFILRIAPELYISFQNKKYKILILQLLVLTAGTIFSLLPMYAQFFIYSWKVSDIANMAGGIQYISVEDTIKYTIIACCITLIHPIWRYARVKKINRNDLVPFFFAFPSLLCLIILSTYQRQSIHHYTYYTFKLSWSIIWIPAITSFVCGTILVYFIISKLISFNIERRAYTPFILAIIATILSPYLLISVASNFSLNLTRAPNALQIADLTSAIDTAKSENKTVIAVSDCSGLEDYIFQKTANSLIATWTEDTYNYTVELVKTKPEDRDGIRDKLLEKSPDDYLLYDFTPLKYINSPANRIKLSSNTIRTRLENVWDTENQSPWCRTVMNNDIAK